MHKTYHSLLPKSGRGGQLEGTPAEQFYLQQLFSRPNYRSTEAHSSGQLLQKS